MWHDIPLTHNAEWIRQHGDVQVAHRQVYDEDRLHVLQLLLRCHGNQNEDVAQRAQERGDAKDDEEEDS